LVEHLAYPQFFIDLTSCHQNGHLLFAYKIQLFSAGFCPVFRLRILQAKTLV